MGDKLKHSRWYVFIGGNPLIPESYHLTTKRPLCSSGKNLCAIYAKGYAEQPEEFSAQLKLAIANAMATGMPQLTEETHIPIVLLK